MNRNDLDVVAVLDSAIRDLAIYCPSADDASSGDLLTARNAVAELIAALHRAKRSARLMHDEHQQEIICIPPAQWRELCGAIAACKPAPAQGGAA